MDSEDGHLFISDEPIEKLDKDQFRHREYVDTLENLVLEVSPPWNIGVFGRWGSGKTSIIRMLYSRLRQQDGYVCVEFDAWRHAEESIRSDLLLNLDRAIGEQTGQEVNGEPGVLGEDQITRELYDVENFEDGRQLSGWEELRKMVEESIVGKILAAIFAIIVIGAVVNLLALSNLVDIKDQVLTSINSVVTAALFPLFVSAFLFMAGEVRRATSTLRRKFPRKEWSGAYEQLFDELLEEAEADTIVISIDNLDRCESETVYDVLVSLKTFLEKGKCIYIIPCDDKALQSHIESIDEQGEYFKEGVNEREFLRKFFQTHIRIPPFIAEDIREYAKSENEQLQEPFDLEVLDVITKAHVKNPRRIKQSLNHLTTLRILAEQIQEEGHLSGNPLTKNMPFLAKISVLQEDYPVFYSRLQNNPRLLKDAHQFFTNELNDPERAAEVKQVLRGDVNEDQVTESSLERFLRSTKTVRTDNLRPFLKLGEPSFASDLSDYKAFVQSLETRQIEEVEEELELVQTDNRSFRPYLEALEDILESYHVERRRSPFVSTIDTIMAVFESFPDDTQREVAMIIGEYLVTDFGKENLNELSPSQVFPIVLQARPRDHQSILTEYTKMAFADANYKENILQAFVENANKIPDSVVTELSIQIDRAAVTGDNLIEVLDILSEPERSLVDEQLLEKAANLVEWEEQHNQFTETKHYLQFDDQASVVGRSYFVERLLDLQSECDENQLNQYENSLRSQLSTLNGGLTPETVEKTLTEIRNLANEVGRNAETVKLCFQFYSSFDSTTKNEFHNWLTSILKSWNYSEIHQIVQEASKQGIQIFQSEQAVENFLSRVPGILGNRTVFVNVIIDEIPKEYDAQVIDLLEQLCENNDSQENILAAEILAEYPDRFYTVKDVAIPRFRKQIKRAKNNNKQKQYLDAKVALFEYLDDANQQSLIGSLNSLLTGNHQDHQNFRAIWSEVGDKLEPEQRKSIFRRTEQQLQTELKRNIQRNQLLPLLEVFADLANSHDVDEESAERIIDQAVSRISTNDLGNNVKAEIIDRLAKLSDFYGQENQTVSRLQNLLRQDPVDNIRKSTEQLLDSLEKAGAESDRIKEARKEL